MNWRERAQARAGRRGQAAETWGMILMLGGVAAVPGMIVAETAISQALDKAAWRIQGPPCPVVARLPASHGRRLPKTHEYGPVRFTRMTGAVSCAAFRDVKLLSNPPPYRVCQFNNPGAVSVATPLQHATYAAPPGRRLTVTVRDGRPSCVVGGWFRL